MRQIYIPAFEQPLCVLMAAPNSAHPDTHVAGLEAYKQLGGNCIHLHGEGGEAHSRRAVGEWIIEHGQRDKLFVCAQILHDGWDEAASQPIDRFTADAVHADVAEHLDLVGIDYLDVVYLDDRPSASFESILESLYLEIDRGRVRHIGVRNWSADRIRAAQNYAKRQGKPGISALFTTELALLNSNCPLWPEYVPFDAGLTQIVVEQNLIVFAHAGDNTLGQVIFGGEDEMARMRPHWITRWDPAKNAELVSRIRQIVAERRTTTRAICVAWLFHQSFNVVSILGLVDLLGDHGAEYIRATELELDQDELNILNGS